MASRTTDNDASRPASRARVIRVDLRRERVAELASLVRQGRYAVDARRLASDLLHLEPGLLGMAERPKP